MGLDAITALNNAITISLQGNLKISYRESWQSSSQEAISPVFDRCVERYMYDDLSDRKKNLDSLAIMAESFVTTVIAFPLFLVIILSVMGLTSGGISFDFLYIISLVILRWRIAVFML